MSITTRRLRYLSLALLTLCVATLFGASLVFADRAFCCYGRPEVALAVEQPAQ
jgi:hypothetical protein